jgi:hypothetical protein
LKMATETLPAAYDREETDFTEQPNTVLIVGAGDNVRNMEVAVGAVAARRNLQVFERRTPLIPVSPDHLHLTNTEEGRRSAAALLGSKTVDVALLSLVPQYHESALTEYLGYAGDGDIRRIVIPKPLVQDVDELRRVRRAHKAAIARRQQIDPSYDPETDPMIRVHEHYRDKGSWRAYCEQHEHVSERLGRLESASIDIQEAQTAEDEGRVLAFSGGALEDLGPHAISLGLEMQSLINSAGRYTIADRSSTSVERFRYEGSELPEGVETGFVIRGTTPIRDNQRNETHSVDFAWCAGKGLVDKKEVRLTFVHPDTGVRSVVIIDLKTNRLTVPDVIKDLFPVTEFDDNGYGHSIEVGLSEGIHQSFQPLSEAETVVIWQQALRNQGSKHSPTIHRRGSELRQLAGVK